MSRFWHNIPGNGLGSTGQREIAHGLGPDYVLTPPPPPPVPVDIVPTPLVFTGPQQGDVLLFQALDDGEINVVGGIVEMSAGLATASYLSMFGGNEDLREWWGDLLETDPTRQYQSETQQLLDVVPAIPANLRRIEDAARRDLAWLIEGDPGAALEISAGIPAPGRVSIAIILETVSSSSAINFVEEWGGGGSGGAGPFFIPIPRTVTESTPASDVLLFQTIDDGEITVVGGVVEMSGGLETSAYLSMFGGDEDLKEWWGNYLETDPARRYRSETQQLLDTIPATSENLRRIEDAAGRDLAWFVSSEVAGAVNVSALIPTVGRVSISVVIEIDGATNEFEFIEVWEASA